MPNIHHTLIHQVYALISEGNAQDLSALLSPDAQLISTHLGQASSSKVVAEALVSGYKGLNPWFNLTNVHTRLLSPASNTRDDRYGSTPEGRARLAIEITHAVAAEIGADRTGIRLSPAHAIQGMDEFDPANVQETYCAYARGIASLGLAFLDILHEDPAGQLVQNIRHSAETKLITNTGFSSPTSREEAVSQVKDGIADAIGVGRPVIANPDLAERWRLNLEENEIDPTTFYVGGARGYTDYPAALIPQA